MVDEITDERRPYPPYVMTEREGYETWLEWHRTTLLIKCEGLDAAGRRARPVGTSRLSLHGLVRHLAEVERSWFQRSLAGLDSTALFYSDAEPEGDLEIAAEASWDDDLAVWRRECATSRTIAADRGLDDTGERDGQPVSLRWIYTRMIEEYARHNGHADLIRELVDGFVGE